MCVDEKHAYHNSKAMKTYKGNDSAYRYATFIQNNYESLANFLRKATADEFDDLEKMYLECSLYRPFSKVFKNTIGDLTKFQYYDIVWICKTLKVIARNDIKEFYSLTDKKTLKRVGLDFLL